MTTLAAHEDGVGLQRPFFADHVHLRVSLLLRLDQLMGLVHARVFDVVLADNDAGNADDANFHAHRLKEPPAMVKERLRYRNACLL